MTAPISVVARAYDVAPRSSWTSAILFFGVLAGGLAAPASVSGAGRALSTIWMIEESPATAEARALLRGGFVFKQRLLPVGVAELGGAQAVLAGLTEGSQLVEVKSPGALVFCDPVIRAQKLIGHAQPCFVDADGDGRFEGRFMTTSVTKGLLSVQGDRPKRPTAITPLPYRRVEPKQFKEQLFVGLQYRGDANPVGNHVFEVNYGTDDKVDKLTDRLLHKKAEVPGTKGFLGGQFTITKASEGSIEVRIDQPLPAQPFGVVQTTTYRFY